MLDTPPIRQSSKATTAAVSDAFFCLVLATLLSSCSLLLLGCFPRQDVLFAASFALTISAVLVLFSLARQGWQTHLLALSFCGVYAFAYPGSGLLLWLFPETAHPMLATDPETLSHSLLVGGLGWLAFVWGYCSHAFRARDSARPGQIGKPATTFLGPLLWVGCSGIAFRLMVQLYSFYEGSDNFLNRGVLPSILANAGMICTCTLWQAGLRRYRVACLVLLAAYSVLGLLSGQRADMFVPALLLTCVMLLGPGGPSRSIRSAVVVAAGLALAIVVSYPLLTRFKLMMGSERTKTAGLERIDEVKVALGQAFDPYCDDSERADETWGDAMLRISTRFSHLQYGGTVVVRGREQVGWLYGASLLDSLIVFVPRVLWPSKPTIGLGEQAYQWMGYQGAGSATVPVAADWYLNFGLPGVAIGMFLTGCGYDLISRRLSRSGPLARTLLAFLIYPLMIAGQGISGLISVVAIHGVVVYLLQRLIAPKRARGSTGNHRGRESRRFSFLRSFDETDGGSQPCRA